MELAPPTLVLTQMEKILRVNATYQLPPCMPSLELKYQVEFWKEGLGSKVGKACAAPSWVSSLLQHCLLYFPPRGLPWFSDSS